MPKYRKSIEPLPVPTPISKPFWDATKEHRLLLQECPTGHRFFYPRSHCPACLSNELAWVDAAGTGHLHSYTVARRPTSPEFAEDVPYVIAVIRLDEGPSMTSMLVECDPDAVEIEGRVEVVWDDVTDEISLPYFRPVT